MLKIAKNHNFNYRLAQVAKGLIAMSIFITHAIANYVAIDIIWRQYLLKSLKDNPKKLLWEYVLRTFVVFVTCEYLELMNNNCG